MGIIREEWMTPRKRQCLWPPYKISSKFNKCLLTQSIPDENWPVHTIRRTFYETDDLIKARSKCKKAESESEIASTDIEIEQKKTRKRKIRSLQKESNDEDSDEESINFELKYPNPPKKTGTIRSSPGLLDFNFDSPIFSYNPTATNEVTTPTTLRYSAHSKESPISSYNPAPTNEETTTTTLPSKLTQKTVLEKINSSLDVIAECLGDIKSEIQEIKQTQNDIIVRLSSPSATALATSLPVEIDMPLKSLDDLRNLQNWLEEEEHKEQLINNLSYIGGKGTGTITRRVLERIFTNSLAVECNWTGKNNKFSLKNLQLIKVIIAAVRRNKVAETATESEITGVITSWFRFARDRNGGRENRRTRSN